MPYLLPASRRKVKLERTPLVIYDAGMKKEFPDVTSIAKKHRLSPEKVRRVYSDVAAIFASKAGRARVDNLTKEESESMISHMVEKRLEKQGIER